MIKFFLSIAIYLLAVSLGQAMPSKVILIRHAEEPRGEEGRELSVRGLQRASLLPKLFKNENIDLLIALRPHKPLGSIRSIQTLQPLAEALRIEIKTPFTRDQVSELVHFLSSDRTIENKTVLISWQHTTIAHIAHGLGARMAPRIWGGDVFDRFWVLEFENGKLRSFLNLPQLLLSRDSRN